jgi:predicted transglutaminase-like cysteine proteinase
LIEGQLGVASAWNGTVNLQALTNVKKARDSESVFYHRQWQYSVKDAQRCENYGQRSKKQQLQINVKRLLRG